LEESSEKEASPSGQSESLEVNSDEAPLLAETDPRATGESDLCGLAASDETAWPGLTEESKGPSSLERWSSPAELSSFLGPPSLPAESAFFLELRVLLAGSAFFLGLPVLPVESWFFLGPPVFPAKPAFDPVDSQLQLERERRSPGYGPVHWI
jgi:hypothetical protein